MGVELLTEWSLHSHSRVQGPPLCFYLVRKTATKVRLRSCFASPSFFEKYTEPDGKTRWESEKYCMIVNAKATLPWTIMNNWSWCLAEHGACCFFLGISVTSWVALKRCKQIQKRTQSLKVFPWNWSSIYSSRDRRVCLGSPLLQGFVKLCSDLSPVWLCSNSWYW